MLMLLLALNIVLAIVVIAWLHNPPLGYGSAAPWLEGWTLSDKIAAGASVSAVPAFFFAVCVGTRQSRPRKKSNLRTKARAAMFEPRGWHARTPGRARIGIIVENGAGAWTMIRSASSAERNR